jgi:Tol biopolymer transport system component
VAFDCQATNFVANATTGEQQVYLRDLLASATELVSQSTDGEAAIGGATAADLSADGRYVVFRTTAPNLVPGSSNHISQVYVRDRLTRTTSVLSVSSTGAAADCHADYPSISGDGRRIVFESLAGNLVMPRLASSDHVFLRDQRRNATACLTPDAIGRLPTNDYVFPALSGNGLYLVFTTAAMLVPGAQGERDVYIIDICDKN